MPQYVPITVRYSRYLWKYELTPAGRTLFFSVLVTSVGMATVMVPVYQIFCVLFMAYIVIWLMNLSVRTKLKVIGQLPRRVTAGDQLRTELTITNLSKWRPTYDVMLWLLDMPAQWRFESADVAIPRLGPGETGSIPVIFRALSRGLYELPELRPHTTFPFNLMRSGSTRHPLGSVTVVPSFHPIQHLDVPVGTRYQPGGIALSSNVGESPEYIGNREYVPGEPIRRLDFRSWARLGKPVVREYQEEYYCRIALVLDTFVPELPQRGLKRFKHFQRSRSSKLSSRSTGTTSAPSQEGNPLALEAAVQVAAAVADSLAATEHLIDLFAAGSQLYVFRAGRNLAHFDDVLDILAAVDACPTNPFLTLSPAIADELSSITTAILILLDWDETRELLARTIIESGCQLKLIIVRDSATTSPLPVDLGEVTQLTLASIFNGGIERL